jgi:4-hydroxy-tetrahydrodipicolinate synthase
VSTFLPELCVQLYDAVTIDGDMAASMQVWDKLWPIIDFMLLNGYVALAKAGAALRGMPLGDPREPIAASHDALRGELKKLLDRSGVAPVEL